MEYDKNQMMLPIKSLLDQDDYGDLKYYLHNHPDQIDGKFIAGNWAIRDDDFSLAMKRLVLSGISFFVPQEVDKLNIAKPYSVEPIEEKLLRPRKLLKNKAIKWRPNTFVTIFYYDPIEKLSKAIQVEDFCSCGFHVVVLDNWGNTNVLKRINQVNYSEFKRSYFDS